MKGILSSILLLAHIYCQELCTATNQSFEEVYPAIHEGIGNNSVPLHFGLMLSLSGKYQSSGALAGVQAALDEINGRDDLLPGYSLHYTLADSECNRTVALGGLFTQLHSPRKKVALIGSGCSLATEATAEISYYHNVPQISCASSSDELSDRVRFPYYFQLLPSEVNLAHVFYSIIKEYGWRRVALIVQNEYRYRATMNVLKQLLLKSNISFSEAAINTENEMDATVFDSESRIFVIATDSKHARRVICEAHTLGLKYPRHLFLTYGSYESQWWLVEDSSEDQCSPKDRADVLQFSLAALHYPLPKEALLSAVKVDADFEFGRSCGDAVWTLAFSLNKTIEGDLDLYGSQDVLKAIKTNLDATNFDGLSGLVHFDENGIRHVTELQMLQYQTTYINGTPIAYKESNQSTGIDVRLRLVTVALLRENETQSRLEFLLGDRNSIWPTYVPIDGMPRTEIVGVSIPVAVIFILVQVCGLLFAIICLLFNFVYRNKKIIRLNSPNLNYLLILGAVLVYLTGIVFVIPSNDPGVLPALCIVRAWLATIGYSLGFGTSVAKLWRVYRIFRKPQAAKTRNGIQDWHLMVFVAILILVDVTALTFYTLLEGLVDNFGVLRVPSKENLSSMTGELAMTTLYYIYLCSTKSWIRTLSLGLLAVYKCALQICALYLAFKTRKVKIKGLNETKYITTLVYIVTLIVILTLVLTFALTDYVNIYAAAQSIGNVTTATFILGLIFIPKMVMLYKDPSGDRVFSNNEVEVGNITKLNGTLHGYEKETDILQIKIKHLETMINEYQKILGVDDTTGRGRSLSLLDMRHSHSSLRPPRCELAQDKRVSVDIPSGSSVDVQPEPTANSANISVTVTVAT